MKIVNIPYNVAMGARLAGTQDDSYDQTNFEKNYYFNQAVNDAIKLIKRKKTCYCHNLDVITEVERKIGRIHYEEVSINGEKYKGIYEVWK